MTNRWSDLDRPPLNETALRHALLTPDALWTALDVVAVTGSTNVRPGPTGRERAPPRAPC